MTTAFVCEACGREFTTEWAADESVSELRERFNAHVDDSGIVCDYCFYLMRLVWEREERICSLKKNLPAKSRPN